MRDYRLVLCALDPDQDRTGYMSCADDERAGQALARLLERHPECRIAMAYDGERLAVTLAQQAAAEPAPRLTRSAPADPGPASRRRRP